MTPLLQAAQAAAPVAAEVLVASIWQGTLLTAGVWLCLRLLGRLTAGVRSAVWSAVLVLVLCLPLLQLRFVSAAGVYGGAVHAERGWGWVLLALWLGASAYRGVGLALEGVRLWGVARRAVPVEPGPAVDALLQRARGATIYASDEVDRPSVLGLGRPRILMPPALLASLSAADMEQVVLHEAEHLRRYDDWTNLLQQIGLLLLPLNPALFWLDRQMCRERELACDDGVLRATRAPKAYAACLVKLAEQSLLRRGVSFALSALGTRARESELVGRVRRVLSGTVSGTATRRARLGAIGAIGLAVLLAGVLAGSPEVVSFDAAAPQLAKATSPAALPPAAASFVAARPVLARAVMRPQASPMRRVSAVLPVHRAPARPVMRVRTTDRQAWWTQLPAARAEVVPVRRVVMTEMEVSQPIYAAVPWRDGWLIVQL